MVNTIENEHLSVHEITGKQTEVEFDLGEEITLNSAFRRGAGTPVRCWYLMGDFGMIRFPAMWGNDSLTACERFLRLNGYAAQDQLPPEAFEYRRHT